MNRKKNVLNTGPGEGLTRQLKDKLDENALKMEELSHDQAQKLAELNRLNQEIEELHQLFPGHKQKKA